MKIIASILVTGVMGLAQAQTYQEQAITSNAVVWTDYSSRSIPITSTLFKFDSSLGTLTSIELRPFANVETRFTGDNNTAQSKNYSATISWAHAFSFAGMPFADTNVLTKTGTVPASGFVQLTFPQNTPSSFSVTDPTAMSAFVGNGSVPVTYSADPNLSFSGFTSTDSRHTVSLGGFVRYHYNAVPEPGTFAMASLGLVLVLRKRKKARSQS